MPAVPDPDRTSTSMTLLLRVRDLADREAWNDFVTRYGPQIFSWCRQFSLQESDAADVTQEVLSKLVHVMQTFAYEPSRGSFRAWLKTVTQNAVRDLARQWQRRARGSGDTGVYHELASVDDGAMEALEEKIAMQYEQELLREAESRVQVRVQEHTWRAYQLTAVEDWTAADAAQELNIAISDVYVAKSRVIKMLREEVQRLESSEP